MSNLTQIPNLVYSDSQGNIFDAPGLWMSGRSGNDFVAMTPEDFIELPDGSDLYTLEGRHPIGFDKETGDPIVYKEGFAVGAQMAPAHTMFYLSAFETNEDAPTLPLFAYTAVGWHKGKFYVPAVRIDNDKRQEPRDFDRQLIERNVHSMIKEFPDNRLLKHIGETCALTYCCPAARNHFMHRFEAPIPTSPACNSNCIGCISFQPTTENITSTQERLTFKPTVKEITEYTIPHLQNVKSAIVSFGQGCEGEPLLMWETIKDSIIEIRKHTEKGSININTNGSMPKAVEELCNAGLNSIRVSLNSVRESIYNSYYLPNNYKFSALKESIKVIRNHGGWASLNYFVFPGVTDEIEEYEELRKFIKETGLNMIQWRNFNIDPDWYLEKIKYTPSEKTIGISKMMKLLKAEFPHLYYGYFNPPAEIIKTILTEKAAIT